MVPSNQTWAVENALPHLYKRLSCSQCMEFEGHDSSAVDEIKRYIIHINVGIYTLTCWTIHTKHITDSLPVTVKKLHDLA